MQLTLRDVAPGRPPGRWEIIDGVRNDIAPAGGQHGRLSVRIMALLGPAADTAGYDAYAAGTGFILRESPLLIRVPDGALMHPARLPEGHDDDGFVPAAPDLAIEVLEPADRWPDVVVKIGHWLDHGTDHVWVLDPGMSTVSIHRPDAPAETLGAGDLLTGVDFLPGFAVEVKRVFALRG